MPPVNDRLLGDFLLGERVGRLGVGDGGDILKGRPSGNPGIGPKADISDSSIKIMQARSAPISYRFSKM
jgi:hypothetical protein